jgi:hypothetical protein
MTLGYTFAPLCAQDLERRIDDGDRAPGIWLRGHLRPRGMLEEGRRLGTIGVAPHQHILAEATPAGATAGPHSHVLGYIPECTIAPMLAVESTLSAEKALATSGRHHRGSFDGSIQTGASCGVWLRARVRVQLSSLFSPPP